MYGKYFSSTFTGSMVGAGSNVFAVWGYIIANCRNGSIELNPKLLAMILGDSEDSVQKAIDFLCSPDPNSRSKNNDGCRLVKSGPFLFDVPNHASYRKILNEDERRAYFRDKKREQRQKAKALTSGHAGQSKTVKDKSTVSTQAEAEAEACSKKAALSPQEFLDSLKTEKAFEGIDIEREMEKAIFWCKNNGRKFTQRFFTNWLNKADRVLPVNGAKKLQTAAEYRAEMDRLAREEEANAR